MAFYVAATFLTPRLKLGIEFVLDDGAGISSGGEQLASYSPPFTGNSHWISKIFLRDVLV